MLKLQLLIALYNYCKSKNKRKRFLANSYVLLFYYYNELKFWPTVMHRHCAALALIDFIDSV